jgi:2-polyprenyl-3-methyl-5-hydroxy-6-metoxy-1,4-benzoquinol methylase
MDKIQLRQENQYEFPYHYIPNQFNSTFSQTKHWSWGYRYLGGIQLILDQLKHIPGTSIIDIGCGDGRFVRDVSRIFPKLKCKGVDYSQKAINLAKALNPLLDYEYIDITSHGCDPKYEIATAIEVLEHIEPSNLSGFIESIANCLIPGGVFLLTVPHKNKSVNIKHYQHFDSEGLIKELDPYFEVTKIIPFDSNSRLLPYFQKLLGGSGKHFIVNNKFILNWFYNYYLDHQLYIHDENKCLRIAAICKRR